MEDYDVEQLFDFAKLFALQGDQEARQAIYSSFLKRVSPKDSTGAITIIELDGLQGFRFVAAQLGGFALTDPDFWDDDYLLRQAEEQSSQEEISDLLRTAQTDDQRIAAYLQVVLESRAHREQYRQKPQIDVAELTYKDIEKAIYKRGGSLAFLWRWGQQASNADLLQVAQKLQTKDVPTVLRHLLAVFRKVSFPLDPQRLLELSQHDDEQVAALAIGALENITHPSVREFALLIA